MPAKRSKGRAPRPKFSKAQVEQHVANVQKAIEQHRRQHKSEHFQGMTAADVRVALARVNSPFIISVGWSSATPGGSSNISVGVFNPDPTPSGPLVVHVFVGPTIGVADTADVFLNVDPRFPRLAQPSGFGLFVAPSGSAVESFNLAVPASMDRSTYIANAALLQRAPFGVGVFLSRSTFLLSVL